MDTFEREQRLDTLERRIKDWDLTIESLQIDMEMAHPSRQSEIAAQLNEAIERRTLTMAEALRLYTMH